MRGLPFIILAIVVAVVPWILALRQWGNVDDLLGVEEGDSDASLQPEPHAPHVAHHAEDHATAD